MSPHERHMSFAADLVEMARAVEELPLVRNELAEARNELERARDTITSRELRIIDLKTEVDDLQAKLRNAEVARDDAELRFLEADDATAKVRAWMVSLAGLLAIPQPQPNTSSEALHEATDQSEAHPSMTGPMIDAGAAEPSPNVTDASQGQREPDPIAQPQTNVNSGDNSSEQAFVKSSAYTDATLAEPSNRYHGRRYIDVPGWVSREDWLAGGGTVEDYDYRG